MYGYMFQLAYGPITWNNKCQLTVAIMSFTKVEYKSLVEGLKESTWLKKITIESGISKEVEATKIW